MAVLQGMRIGAVALAAAMGAGCSAGPSESDAKAAVAAEFTRAFGGAVRVDEVRDFELAGCRKAEQADGYACDVTGEVVLDIAGTKQVRPLHGNFRFRKDDGRWVVYGH